MLPALDADLLAAIVRCLGWRGWFRVRGACKALRRAALPLKRADLRGCYEITDTGLEVLVGHCNGLTHLDVSRCYMITDAGLHAALAGRCACPRVVELAACCKITAQGAQALQGVLPRCALRGAPDAQCAEKRFPANATNARLIAWAKEAKH